MITTILKGGLGNQLFQIFNLISYSFSNKIDFFFKPQISDEKRPFYWNNFLKTLKPYIKSVDTRKIYKEQKFHYTEIPFNDHFYFDGYFQSYKYFQSNEKEIFKIINLYSQRDDIKNKYKQFYEFENYISIHFRIGDYKDIQLYHPILNVKYYINALEHILSKTGKKWNVLYFYEENDKIAVKRVIDILRVEYSGILFTPINTNIIDHEQLLLMSLCNHNIIANSTFSWWGAYFNLNENKIVCYPNTWFGPKNVNKIVDDLFPDTWCKINDNVYKNNSDYPICFSEVFYSLKDYIIVKMNNSLPYTYKINEDLDIFTKNLNENIDIIVQLYDKNIFRHTITMVSKNHAHLDLFKHRESFLHFRFDIFDKFEFSKFSLDASIGDFLLKNKTRNCRGAYVPCLKDDLSLRYCEYIEYPQKIKHLNYVNNFSDIDFHRVLVNEKKSLLNYSMIEPVYLNVVVWGHGIQYITDILNIIMTDIDCDILNITKHEFNNVEQIINKCYKLEMINSSHIMNKTKYLNSVKKEFIFILLKILTPKNKIYGTGDFKIIADENMVNCKWKIREKYNPRNVNVNKPPLTKGITHEHVIHVTDNNEETTYLTHAFLNKYPKMYEDYDLELNNVNIKIPWHIQKPKKAHVKNINIKTLYANIINKKNCIIEDTPHYKYVTGDTKSYSDYYSKYLGKYLQDNHTTMSFDKLIKNFNIEEYKNQQDRLIIINKDNVVIDGLHRLSILKYDNNIENINVVVFTY